MKVELYVEFQGEQIDTKRLTDLIKEIWRNDGNLMKDLKSVEVYYKPEERKCYYILNNEQNGQFEI